jgi:hypothetical protein
VDWLTIGVALAIGMVIGTIAGFFFSALCHAGGSHYPDIED